MRNAPIPTRFALILMAGLAAGCPNQVVQQTDVPTREGGDAPDLVAANTEIEFVNDFADAEAPAVADPDDAQEEAGIDVVAELGRDGEQANELRKLSVLHPDSEVRKAAVESLAESAPEIAFESLVVSLGDDDDEIVLTAIEGLEALEDPAAIPALKRLARGHDDEVVQQAANRAIEFLE